MPSPKPNQPAPLCKCGCGQQVEWIPSRNRWGRFIHGHNQRGRPSPNRKNYGSAPLCTCGCGKRITSKRHGKWCVYLHGHQFRGQSHTQESRDKMRESKLTIADEIAERVTGSGNPMWRNGHAGTYHAEQRAAGWNWWHARKMRQKLIAERGHQCERCERTETKLELHHIDHDLSNNQPDNFQLVCRSCQIKATVEFIKDQESQRAP